MISIFNLAATVFSPEAQVPNLSNLLDSAFSCWRSIVSRPIRYHGLRINKLILTSAFALTKLLSLINLNCEYTLFAASFESCCSLAATAIFV